jgi:hypothetical protein
MFLKASLKKLYASMETAIKETESRILIVDNITYLKSETERPKMLCPDETFEGLETKFNLSILALAHTPKMEASKPINKNHLQGSKMLINFCDSSFAIGENQETGLRYLKQIKAEIQKSSLMLKT